MKIFFFIVMLLFSGEVAFGQTNDLWYKSWRKPFLVLFEKDTFDVAESRLFLPYRIFESFKKKTELIYKYTNYKERGYYRCTYQRGKLQSRVLYLSASSHQYPGYFSPVAERRLIKYVLSNPGNKNFKIPSFTKDSSAFTVLNEGHFRKKAFRADTFFQTVDYFTSNGRIDSVVICRQNYLLLYKIAYDSLGRLTVVHAVENGDSYVAQRRKYSAVDPHGSSYYFIVKDSLMGYSRLRPREKETLHPRRIAHDEIEDTNYFFNTTHILSPDGKHEIYYKAYEITRGSFIEIRHYARCGQDRSAGSSYLATQKMRYESAEFKKEVRGRATLESFCPNGYETLVGNTIFVDPSWGYTLSRFQKHPRHFSVYAKPPNSIQECEYPKGVDSMKLMEVFRR